VVKPSLDTIVHDSSWEHYVYVGEALFTNSRGASTYKMRVPDSDEFIVVKPKDIESTNRNHPRKTAIFQELTAVYGIPTVQEVTVERNGKAIRIARYVHALRLASTINQGDRDHLEGSDRELVEAWFPEDIFDDYMTVQRHSQGTTWYTAYIDRLFLNADKFRKWYRKASDDKKEKAKASLQALHDMVNNGFLFDLYGVLNLAFHDDEFVLTDVEPLQLSNVGHLKPSVVTYSEDLLSDLFSVVGLPQVSYSDIVRRNYGDDSILKVTENFNPMAANGRHSKLYTNVTDAEELQLYESQLVVELVA
jgi:hypothetical protein